MRLIDLARDRSCRAPSRLSAGHVSSKGVIHTDGGHFWGVTSLTPFGTAWSSSGSAQNQLPDIPSFCDVTPASVFARLTVRYDDALPLPDWVWSLPASDEGTDRDVSSPTFAMLPPCDGIPGPDASPQWVC